MEYIRLSRNANSCKSIMFTPEIKVYCLLSMTITRHACLQSPSSLSAAVVFHIKSSLLMSSSYFQDSNFTTRTTFLPAPFKQEWPEFQISGGPGIMWTAQGQSARAGDVALSASAWSMLEAGWGFGATQYPLLCLNSILKTVSPFIMPAKTKLQDWTVELLVVSEFKCRGEFRLSMGLPDAGSLTGGGGSWVPSCSLDTGRVPAWQLWAVYDLTAPGVPLQGLPKNHSDQMNPRQQQVLEGKPGTPQPEAILCHPHLSKPSPSESTLSPRWDWFSHFLVHVRLL